MSTPKTYGSISWDANTYGVIEAIKEAQARAGGTGDQGYPPNTWGVIKALQDLDVNGNVIIDDSPPNWAPGEGGTNNENTGWYPTTEPQNGTLWYDTRQGRLYVWSDDNWYQTNGADGYAIVSPTPPENPVKGQFWVDSGNSYSLYVFTTEPVDINRGLILGTITDANTVAYQEAWVPVAGDGTLQNTATLPLANPTTVTTDSRAAVEFPDTADLAVQADFNVWIIRAFNSVLNTLHLLDHSANVYVDELPPVNTPGTETNPGYDIREGDLWFDTNRIDLNIYYQGYWVSVSGAQEVTMEKIDRLSADVASVSQEVGELVRTKHDLLTSFSVHENSVNTTVQELKAELQRGIQNISSLTTADVQAVVDPVETELNQLKAVVDGFDFSGFALNNAVTQKFGTVEQQISDLENTVTNDYWKISAATAYIDGVRESIVGLIPDVSDKVDAAYVNQQIGLIDYMPRGGGNISSFKIIRQTMDKAAFDFSTSSTNSYKAFEFKAKGCDYTNTFGATNTNKEMAWEFKADEDYCWIHNGNKVASINKNSVACTELQLVSFAPNGENGVLFNNTIDVRERLNAYQTALVGVRNAVNQSTDFESLKSNLLSALTGV